MLYNCCLTIIQHIKISFTQLTIFLNCLDFVFRICLAMADAKIKLCARWGIGHILLTGKRKCKRQLPPEVDVLNPLDELADTQLDLDTATVPVLPWDAVGERSADDWIDTLVVVVSELVSRVDSTQRQLSSFQLAVSSPSAAVQVHENYHMARFRSQGAINKSPASCSSVHLMKLLWTKFEGTYASYMCAKKYNEFCRCSSFWEEEVWSNCWWQRVREAMA
jgi:hypothetical protein